MKRSRQVYAPLLASTAFAVLTTGCHPPPEAQRCVDENNKVVDASFCGKQPANSQINNAHLPGFYPYHFYYGGYGGFAPGSLARGGAVAPVAGHSYSTSPSAITRGGFGSSHGGGEGEGGGHGGGGGE